MKQIRRSMRLVIVILSIGFLLTGSFLAYTVFSQGGRLLISKYNSRINTARQTVTPGNVTDRAGLLLATTNANGERRYAKDKQTRRALSQTVGDPLSMSGTGVETFHAGTLLGFTGSIIDRSWQFINGGDYRGDNISLTVSAELTKYISEQFPKNRDGAVVVINYKTGDILSEVSMPNYDPQTIADRGLQGDLGTAFLNRCTQGQYTPGSVFKIVTLAAALENIPGVAQREFSCTGPRIFGESTVTCYGGTKHGKMNLFTAFAQSCNVTFASLAYEMGARTIIKTAESLGFNKNYSFRDLVLYESSIPENIPDVGELAWTGVGQGKLLVTPMHMAMLTGAVANNGLMKEPQLIRQITGAGGLPKLRTAGGNVGQILTPTVAQAITQYMKKAVDSGTATGAKIKGYSIAGKTGSAETSNDKKVATDSWYCGFVDDPSSPYAIAVVIEKGGAGSAAAAPLAAKALKKAISLGLNS